MSDEPAEESAADRWSTALQSWALPEHIVAAAPRSPWHHDTRSFMVDGTLDRSVLPAELARSVLPATGGSVLDVGCGGGRASMSLTPPAVRVIGVDEDPAMLAAFTSAAAAAGARSATIEGRWPDVADECPTADLVVCHHVAYNVADIVPFVEALTDHARLAVVVVLPTRHPQTTWNHAWRHFWQLERPTGPTDRDFGAVLDELGINAERFESPRPPLAAFTADPASRVPSARRRLCLGDDRSDDEIGAYLDAHEPDWPTVHVVYRWPGAATS